MHPSSASSSTSESSTSMCSAPESSTVGDLTLDATAPLSHPFAHAKGLLVVIPQDRDKVDVEEESAFYDEFDEEAFGVCKPLVGCCLYMQNLLTLGY